MITAEPVPADTQVQTGPQRRYTLAFWITLAVTVGSAAATLAPLVDEAVGALCLVTMLGLLCMRAPVWISLLVPALIGLGAARGWRLIEGSLSTAPYNAVAQWSFSVLPAFIFMGMLIASSGLASDIFMVMRRCLGWLPGGLAIGANAAGAGLATVSGSTMGVVYTLARVSIPEMLRAGYNKRLATAAVMLGGLTGNLIPPSILLVIYAGLAETPVGPQLLAGLAPGVLLALLVSAALVTLAMARPKLVRGDEVAMLPGARGDHTAKAKVAAREGEGTARMVLRIWPIPLILVTTVGGLYTGTFTATEVGAASALVCLIATWVWRRGEQPWAAVQHAAVGTVSAVGIIFIMLIAVDVFSTMLTVTGVGRVLVESLTDLGLGRLAFLLILVPFYLLLGMFMDTLAMMVVTVPLLLPVLQNYEVSPLWFGVFVVFMGEIAMITPPVGVLTYVLHGVMQDPEVNLGTEVTLRDVFVSVAWVIPGVLAFCLILIFFPGIVEIAVGGS